jgi:hypothetical protein
MVKLGDWVEKKSRKPFENGTMKAMIIGWGTIYTNADQELDAVELGGLTGLTELRRLREINIYAPSGGPGSEATNLR